MRTVSLVRSEHSGFVHRPDRPGPSRRRLTVLFAVLLLAATPNPAI